MTTSNLIIRIPEPCQEDWNNMLPDAKGKFCSSCSKPVFDFSTKTDHEIRHILLEHKDEKVCGRFNKTQVNRPLNIRVNLRDLPRNMSATRAFAIALFIVFGTFLFSCTNEYGQKVDAIEVLAPEEDHMTLGEPMFFTPPVVADSVRAHSVTNVEMVAGGLSYDYVQDSVVTLEEATVIQHTEPIVDYAVLGGISYVVMDSAITEETAEMDSSFVNNARMNENSINPKTNGLTVYPNPSNGQFTVRYNVLKRADMSLVIYDLNGIMQRSLVNMTKQYEGKYEIPVNLNELPNGVYIVSMINDGKKTTERLVIER